MDAVKEQDRILGLLGFPLGHSYSKKWFEEKFFSLRLDGWQYLLLERSSLVGLKEELSRNSKWLGFNVTVPHKQNILPFLDSLDPTASRIGAVNVVKAGNHGSLRGYNSDYHGFLQSLLRWLPYQGWKQKTGLILGNGGSARAVKAVLEDLDMKVIVMARKPADGEILWDSLPAEAFCQTDLIVQCTPAGMHPEIHIAPTIPDGAFRKDQFVMDLIYNPAETRFLAKAASLGAKTQNGLFMLEQQAEKAWEIWNLQE
jgi:shikimate dehydrogenase